MFTQQPTQQQPLPPLECLYRLLYYDDVVVTVLRATGTVIGKDTYSLRIATLSFLMPYVHRYGEQFWDEAQKELEARLRRLKQESSELFKQERQRLTVTKGTHHHVSRR